MNEICVQSDGTTLAHGSPCLQRRGMGIVSFCNVRHACLTEAQDCVPERLAGAWLRGCVTGGRCSIGSRVHVATDLVWTRRVDKDVRDEFARHSARTHAFACGRAGGCVRGVLAIRTTRTMAYALRLFGHLGNWYNWLW